MASIINLEEFKKLIPKKHKGSVERRLLKALEEMGEISEAYLSMTSEVNYKNKKLHDVNEEIVDVLILLLDTFMMLNKEDDLPVTEMILNGLIRLKTKKWVNAKERDSILKKKRVNKKK